MAMADAAFERLRHYRAVKTQEAIKSGELEDDGFMSIPLEELLPWEDDLYAFKYLGVSEHNDFYIHTDYGVHLKDANRWVIVQEIYHCESMAREYLFLISDSNFQEVSGGGSYTNRIEQHRLYIEQTWPSG